MGSDIKFNFLYPYRFITLASHLLLTAQLYEAGSDLIRITMSTADGSTEFKERADQVNLYITLNILFLSVDFACMLSGVSLARPRVTLMNGTLHLFGFIFTFLIIVDGWHWASIIYIFFMFTVPAALLEVSLALVPVVMTAIALLRRMEAFLLCVLRCCRAVYASCCCCGSRRKSPGNPRNTPREEGERLVGGGDVERGADEDGNSD
jgi:hypothetical protein